MINEKIKEVNDYFVKQLQDGNYTVEEVNEHMVHLTIDGFKFSFWTANSSNSFECFNIASDRPYTMYLQFTDAQRTEIHGKLHQLSSEYIKEVKIKKLQEELESLQSA